MLLIIIVSFLLGFSLLCVRLNVFDILRRLRFAISVLREFELIGMIIRGVWMDIDKFIFEF